MNTCPVYRRSGGHSYESTVPGPIGSILAPAKDAKQYHSLPYACSLCGSCTDVCPVKIDLHHQLFISRRQLANLGLVSFSKRLGLKVVGAVLARPWLYRIAGSTARLALRISPRWLVYNRFNIWGRQRDLPPPPRRTFRELYAARQQKK